MINRENGLTEIYNRIYAAKDTIGLKGFKRTPTRPIDEKYLPCVFMIEGTDEITSNSSRGSLQYPCKRSLEVILEIVTDKSVSVKDVFRQVRSAVFSGGIVVADDNTFIQEIRTEGPTGYGLPDVVGLQFVLAMSYIDNGL